MQLKRKKGVYGKKSGKRNEITLKLLSQPTDCIICQNMLWQKKKSDLFLVLISVCVTFGKTVNYGMSFVDAPMWYQAKSFASYFWQNFVFVFTKNFGFHIKIKSWPEKFRTNSLFFRSCESLTRKNKKGKMNNSMLPTPPPAAAAAATTTIKDDNKRCPIISTKNGSILNDDCLVELFKHMKVVQLIDLCCFCRHCLDLMNQRIFTRRKIDFNELRGKYDTKQVLACFGSSAANLAIHRQNVQITKPETTDSHELLDMLTKNCDVDVLKQLDITVNFSYIDTMCIAPFAVKLRRIRELKVTASHYRSSHPKLSSFENDHRIELLVQNSNIIATMHLKMFSISGHFLHQSPLKYLTELALVQCDQIQTKALIQSAPFLGRLSRFVWINSKFDGFSGISENIQTLCNILGDNFTKLSSVTVHMNYGVYYCHHKDESVLNGLRELTNLESLSIGVAGACACNNFFAGIQKLNQLKHLAIESPVTFAGRQCLPCNRVLSNYLPKVLGYLPHLISLRLIHANKHNEHLLDEIGERLPQIQELHLNGYHKMNAEKLHCAVQKMHDLKIVNLKETKFHFDSELYFKLVEECIQRKRLLKIFVGSEMRRSLLAGLKDAYRKEFVQILD